MRGLFQPTRAVACFFAVLFSPDYFPFDILIVLQHTARHCNTLQHAATYRHMQQHMNLMCMHQKICMNDESHCSTLQRTAALCSALQHTEHAATQAPICMQQQMYVIDVSYCNSLQQTATPCKSLQHAATQNSNMFAPTNT